jgi:predicted RNA-binding Zn ribbon-like protein
MQGKPFELVAGNVALDLVNTLDSRFDARGPEDLLGSYEDLLRFLVQSETLSVKQAGRLWRATREGPEGARVLGEVRELREALARAAYARLDGKKARGVDLEVLEREFQRAGANRRLGVEGPGFAWSWKDGGDVHLPLWMMAQAATDLLLSQQLGRLRSCGVDTCRWLFLDTSKNGTRRWCDMKICGNRMKAKRYQARLAGD